MTEEQRLEKVREAIAGKRDSTSKILSVAKDELTERFIKSAEEMQSFTVKIAELSLLIGAAIIPVLLVATKDKELIYPNFIFLAMIAYLVNGIVALWRSKDMLEDRLMSFDPANLLEVEADTLPMIFAANKLIWDPNNQNYIEEYRSVEKEFISRNAQRPTTAKKINIWLDAFVATFVFASLALARPLWPFGNVLYWIVIAIFTLIIVALTCLSAWRVRESQIRQEAGLMRVNKLKQDHADWNIKEVIEKSGDAG